MLSSPSLRRLTSTRCAGEVRPGEHQKAVYFSYPRMEEAYDSRKPKRLIILVFKVLYMAFGFQETNTIGYYTPGVDEICRQVQRQLMRNELARFYLHRTRKGMPPRKLRRDIQ
jgi:hypothetical protein